MSSVALATKGIICSKGTTSLATKGVICLPLGVPTDFIPTFILPDPLITESILFNTPPPDFFGAGVTLAAASPQLAGRGLPNLTTPGAVGLPSVKGIELLTKRDIDILNTEEEVIFIKEGPDLINPKKPFSED